MRSCTADTIPNALQVPAAAILPTEDGGTTVLVVGRDSTAQKRAVKVGFAPPEKVQILSGVTAQDMVVTDGGYGLDDGTKVKVSAARTTTTSRAADQAPRPARRPSGGKD